MQHPPSSARGPFPGCQKPVKRRSMFIKIRERLKKLIRRRKSSSPLELNAICDPNPDCVSELETEELYQQRQQQRHHEQITVHSIGTPLRLDKILPLFPAPGPSQISLITIGGPDPRSIWCTECVTLE